jgi:DNA repair exonuclease SbcCD ATPase subunit
VKLRLIELTNVRRFAGQTARLGPFADGLTTVTAENEAGKSTFFDALHALFFVSHTSKAAETKALQPYSGGAVIIAAEIGIEDASYRIEKTFLSGPSARVIDLATGLVVKQQGDAEAWIDSQINSSRKGPAGLLWVRQGDVHLDPEGRGKDADNIAARRDLMSSVRGQIDAVTGGRRMDRIMERCRAEFDALSTQTFRAKANSRWKQIEDEIAHLTTERDDLAAKVAQLSQALKVKSQAAARLRALQDAEKQAARALQVKDAAAALALAKQHADSLTRADQAAQLVEADQNRIARTLKEIIDAKAARARLKETIGQTRERAAQARSDRKTAEAALAQAQTAVAEKDSARRALLNELGEERAAQKQADQWRRLHLIAELLKRVNAPRTKLTAALAVLDRPAPTQAEVDQMTALSQKISIATEQRRAHFASVRFVPSGDGHARLDGAALPNAPVLIDRPLQVAIDGFGAVHLAPATGTGLKSEDPEALGADLAGMLLRFGFDTLQDARAALLACQNAQNDAQVARAEIQGLAPDGTDALEAEQAALLAQLNHPADMPLPQMREDRNSTGIEDRITVLEQEIEALRSRAAICQDRLTQTTGAEATAQGVLTHLESEQQAAAPKAGEDAQLAQLQHQQQETARRAETARADLAALQSGGPDLAAAQALFDRVHSADQADRNEIETLRRELARVDGAIEAQSEGAVEEKLAAVTDALEAAAQQSARYAKQARALKMLIDHLDAARKDAQETYFEPIRTELRPLLAQLHGGAGFEIDPEKMLVNKITRNGVTDDVSVLSGGAYEQIAILTRLAFARLFARQGRHVPVILDDALVHTDDARIETMFNMLSGAAGDQQIIVFSCRTRAFSDLGGTRATIEVT